MITYKQFKSMKPKHFVDILLWHNYHLLAFEVARALGVDDTSPIYTDWAIKKLKASIWHNC